MSTEIDRPLSLGAWLERLSAVAPAPLPDIISGERAAILDLARVAAHGSERIAAPISAYLVGLALASRAADDRAAALRELVIELERPPGS